jgi:signal recognition particle subunit SRP19
MRRKGLIIFWPQYFDGSRSYRLGRKVTKELATNHPTVNDLFEAAKKLGYYAEIDAGVKYPRTWYDDPGRVLIDTMGQKKTFVLKKIAPELQKIKVVRDTETKNQGTKKKDQKRQQKMESLKEKIKQHRGK